jgi:hypothetical protein
MVKRVERRKQPCADRGGAAGGKLLAADNGAKSGIPALAAADRRHTGLGKYGVPARVLFDQGPDGCFQIGLGVDDVRHDL